MDFLESALEKYEIRQKFILFSSPYLSDTESTNRRLVFIYRRSMRTSLLTLYDRKIGASSSRNSRGGVSSNRIPRSRSPEKWVEIPLKYQKIYRLDVAAKIAEKSSGTSVGSSSPLENDL